jgi:ATP-dependent RNA helicase DDX1
MAGGFDSLALLPELIKAVTEMGWFLPTDVQDETIPLILGGGDVMVAAETGSGKTGKHFESSVGNICNFNYIAAFALPVIQLCIESLRKQPSTTILPSTVATTIRLSDSNKDVLLQITSDGLSTMNVESSKSWLGVRATHGVKGSGKYYYEASIHGQGLARLGWSTSSANLELGKDANGYGYGATAMKSTANKFEAYGVKFNDNDVIGCCLDLDTCVVEYLVNGVSQGIAFHITSNTTSVYFPAIAVKGKTTIVVIVCLDLVLIFIII